MELGITLWNGMECEASASNQNQNPSQTLIIVNQVQEARKRLVVSKFDICPCILLLSGFFDSAFEVRSYYIAALLIPHSKFDICISIPAL
jgi:hypothetical protein